MNVVRRAFPLIENEKLLEFGHNAMDIMLENGITCFNDALVKERYYNLYKKSA